MNSISIIIPVHNSIKYLDECIQSVADQISEGDEIILVENGSSDDTPKLCKEYCKKYSFIKYIELGAVGVSVARNEGLKVATKEWVTFVDSDDTLQEDIFNEFREKDWKGREIVIAKYSNTIFRISDDDRVKKVNEELLLKGILRFAKYVRAIRNVAYIDNFNNWACWGRFYRNSFLKQFAIQFPEGIALSEDVFFNFQAYIHAKEICSWNKTMYYYRENNNSVSRKHYDGLFNNNMKLLDMFEKYRNSNNLGNKYSCDFIVFYARKIIEIYRSCIGDNGLPKNEQAESELKALFSNKKVISIIKNAPYFNIIYGKKNSINYAILLYKIKRIIKRKTYELFNL